METNCNRSKLKKMNSNILTKRVCACIVGMLGAFHTWGDHRKFYFDRFYWGQLWRIYMYINLFLVIYFEKLIVRSAILCSRFHELCACACVWELWLLATIFARFHFALLSFLHRLFLRFWFRFPFDWAWEPKGLAATILMFGMYTAHSILHAENEHLKGIRNPKSFIRFQIRAFLLLQKEEIDWINLCENFAVLMLDRNHSRNIDCSYEWKIWCR